MSQKQTLNAIFRGVSEICRDGIPDQGLESVEVSCPSLVLLSLSSPLVS